MNVLQNLKKIKLEGGMKISTIPGWNNPSSPEHFTNFCIIGKDNQAKISNYNNKDVIVDTRKNNYGILLKHNNLLVVDLDFYKNEEEKENKFLQTFGTEFVKRFNTLTQKTTSGGFHLIFNDTDLLDTTYNKTHNIDILKSGYIVGAGSVVKGKSYKLVNDTSIKDIPDELVEWLIKNIEIKVKKRVSNSPNTYNNQLKYYQYNIDNKTAETIIKDLNKNTKYKYITQLQYWKIFTEFLWKINNKELWLNYSKGYTIDEKHLSYWENPTTNMINSVDTILNEAKTENIINYCKFKKLLPNLENPTEIINEKHLGKYDSDGVYTETYDRDGKDLIFKSCMGSGKTNYAMEYIKKEKCKYVSIVKLIALARDHFKRFEEKDLRPKFYDSGEDFTNADNVITTIDSIHKLRYIDFTNRVVVLDEIDATIEYLLTSDTLHSVRVERFFKFIEIIRKCKKVIGFDGDLTDATFQFLNICQRDYRYIFNKYKNFQGIMTEEIPKFDEMIKLLKKEKEFLVASDKKQICNDVFVHLGGNLSKPADADIKLITADTNGIVNSDLDYPKVIFSPRIIQGLDSNRPRNVYYFADCQSINPKQMVQQIARERKVLKVFYCFTGNKFFNEKNIRYNILNDALKDIKYIDNRAIYEIENKLNIRDIAEKEIYLNLLARYKFNDDAYNTNKFAHFLNELESRGFIVNKKYTSVKADWKKQKSNEKEYDLTNASVERRNEYLRIPKDLLEDYKIFVADNYEFNYHLLYCCLMFFTYDEVKEKIEEKNDFFYNLEMSNTRKVLFLKKLIDETNAFNEDKTVLSPKNIPNDYYVKYFTDEYALKWKNRETKERDFTNLCDISVVIGKKLKECCGNSIILNNKKNRTKNVYTQFLDKELMLKHRELFEFRRSVFLEKTI